MNQKILYDVSKEIDKRGSLSLWIEIMISCFFY